MEITEHQANMLRALADGKKLEAVHEKTAPGKWFEIQTLDNFMLFISSPDWYEVRIKPDVIVVNGIEVPAPVKDVPDDGQCYWVADVTCKNGASGPSYWVGDAADRMWLALEILHDNEVAAAVHGKAMRAHKPG